MPSVSNNKRFEGKERLLSLVMLLRGLISRQRRAIVMIAQQSVVEAFAALNGIGDGWPAHYETLVLDAWHIFEFLEAPDEQIFVLLRDF